MRDTVVREGQQRRCTTCGQRCFYCANDPRRGGKRPEIRGVRVPSKGKRRGVSFFLDDDDYASLERMADRWGESVSAAAWLCTTGIIGAEELEPS